MDVKLPHLGEGADSGTVVNLFVKEGDQISKDQPLLELENEKAVATIPSTVSGKVTKVAVRVGEKVAVGQTILSVSGAETASKTVAQPATSRPAPREETMESSSYDGAPGASGREEEPGGPPAGSPALRKLARDLGIDLSRVRGTARGGRIVIADLRAYIQKLQNAAQAASRPGAAAPKPAPEPLDFSKFGPVTRKPLSPLREVIARRMLENWTTIPHVTQFDSADVTSLIALRKKHVPAYEKKGARLTMTAILLKIVVNTLKRHPAFNSSFDESAQAIVLKEYFNFGIAVDTEAGLIVPVIRDVDKKSLVELSKELESIAAKARDRKLSGDDLKGGTFTISNQGGIGGGHFTPIINKPEAAILGLGRAALQPVAREGRIEPRTLLPIALSYDHRVLDGGQAARFVVDLVKGIEGVEEKLLTEQ
ncbi:MAG TPA: 2-oxo acid dehydrogenase subunit E2 [Verrucomicrobiae bacterium]|nr:2-oxo acid dehydrogenase subunit E2 [Verrucomicrobiae bacterium]